MVDIKTLLPELRKLVLALAEDLLARATSDKQIDTGLREAFSKIEKAGRTAQAFDADDVCGWVGGGAAMDLKPVNGRVDPG